jgi:hypothetical protein
MTFSSASVSACEVDDVVAMAAAGGGGLRGGGKAACWRVAGAPGAAGAVVLSAVFAAGVVLGAALRAIGRGLGNGTFCGVARASPAQASPANADNPTASARHVVSAVDRNAAARLDGVTAFLRGESFNRWSPKLYSIEYMYKMLKYAVTLPCLRQHRGKIAAGAVLGEGGPVRVEEAGRNRNLGRAKVAPARAFRRTARPDMNGGFQ